MTESRECVGVITRIDLTEIWFEFLDEAGFKSFASVKMGDFKSGSRNFRVGDKLKCAIVQNEDGETDWIATSGELFETGCESIGDNEDVIMLEDQLDFENEEDYDEEEVDESEEQKYAEGKIEEKKAEQQTVIKKTSQLAKKEGSGDLYNEKAVLFQLLAPKFDRTKTTMALYAVLTGKFKGQSLAVPGNRTTVWGYSLENANLVQNLQYGDECSIEFRAFARRNAKMIDKRVWIGPKDLQKPAVAASNPDFAAWLKRRKLSEVDFLKWVNDDPQLPQKPFFPLTCYLYSARVVGIAWDTNNVGVGAFLQIGNMYKPPSPMIVSKPMVPRDIYAFMKRENFYLCGVGVGNANLCHLLWPDDAILVQLQQLTRKSAFDISGCLSQRPDLNVTYSAYFGNLGPDRPKEQILDPKKANNLTNYLKKKNLNLQHFEAMIAGTYRPATADHQNQYQQKQQHQQQKPANPKPLLELNLQTPFGAQNKSKIEKIQTNHGLVLTTRKSVEKAPTHSQERPKLKTGFDHKPSKKVDAAFVQTKRLEDFRSNNDQRTKTKISEVRSEPDKRSFLLENPNVQKKQTPSQPDDEFQVIVNRILDLESVDDFRVQKLLQNKAEVKAAMKMMAILTKALNFSMNDPQEVVKSEIPDSDRGKRMIESEDRLEQVKRPRTFAAEARTRPDEIIVRPQTNASRDLNMKPQPLMDVRFEGQREDYPRRERSPERGRVLSSIGAKYEEPMPQLARGQPASDSRFEEPMPHLARGQSSSGSRFENPMPQLARGQSSSGARFEEPMPQTRREPEMTRDMGRIYPVPRHEEPVEQRRRDVGPIVSQVRGASYPDSRCEEEAFASERRREGPEPVSSRPQPSMGYRYEDERFDNRQGQGPERFVQPGNSREGKTLSGPVPHQKPSNIRFDVNPMLKVDSQDYDRYYDDPRRPADSPQTRKSLPVNPFYDANEEGVYETFGVQSRNEFERPANAPLRPEQPMPDSSSYRRENFENSAARNSDRFQPGSSYDRRSEITQPRNPVDNRQKEVVQGRYQEHYPDQRESHNRTGDRFPDPSVRSDWIDPSTFQRNSAQSFVNPFQASVSDGRQGPFSRPQPSHGTQGQKPGGRLAKPAADFPKPAGSCMAKDNWESWN